MNFALPTGKIDRIIFYISIFLRVVLVGAAVFSVVFGNWTALFASVLAFVLSFLPALIERNFNVLVPAEFEIVISIFLFASLYLGEVQGYYTKFWWWDVVLHGSSGIIFGLIGFVILYIFYTEKKIKTNPFFIVLFSFTFGIAVGSLWEIVEFSIDSIFEFNLQKSGLQDTMWDIIVDAIGAFIASVFGYQYLKRVKESWLHKILQPFFEENPRYQKK